MKRKIRVLVACEESQTVANALRALGIEAYSCDIEPCSGGHPEYHLQQDVIPLLTQEWDAIIAFPPCDHLAVSGARHFEAKRKDGRQQQGIDFFMAIANAPCKRIAIENPIGIMSSLFRKPDQIIHPWMFGDPFTKSTCLWLKGLPLLTPTNVVEKGEQSPYGDGNSMATWISNAPMKNRKKIRSKTFPGIAAAMAEQWGNLLISELQGQEVELVSNFQIVRVINESTKTEYGHVFFLLGEHIPQENQIFTMDIPAGETWGSITAPESDEKPQGVHMMQADGKPFPIDRPVVTYVFRVAQVTTHAKVHIDPNTEHHGDAFVRKYTLSVHPLGKGSDITI